MISTYQTGKSWETGYENDSKDDKNDVWNWYLSGYGFDSRRPQLA